MKVSNDLLFNNILDRINSKYPYFSKRIKDSSGIFGLRWNNDLIELIQCLLLGKDEILELDNMIEGYVEFSTEAIREQIYFEKNGRYRANSYEEVNNLCYQNEEFMMKKYLPGLIFSHFVWPHHYKLLSNYTKNILEVIKPSVKTFYEIGIGCGLYTKLTLEKLKETKAIGYDISPHSIQFSNCLMSQSGLSERFKAIKQDIIKHPVHQQADFLICQEVLEHLENPEEFIFELIKLVRLNGYAYITAAVNAGHTDHIYLYKSAEEVEIQLSKAGWTVISQMVESNAATGSKSVVPSVASFLLQKK